MALTTRLTAAMLALIVLTASAVGLLTIHDGGPLAQLAGLAAAASVIVLAPTFATSLARTAGNLAAAESKRRHHLETELAQCQQQERILSTAVELTTSPMITTALDGTITGWNTSAERLYLYTAAEAIGKNIDIIVPNDRRDEHLDILSRSRNEPSVYTFETVRIGKDGRRIDVSVSISAIKSAAGEIIGASSVTHDLTARNLAEEKFRLAVESCPSGIVMVDRSGRILMVNTEVERLFGYLRHELMGQSVDVLVPERMRSPHAHNREGFMRNSETRRMGSGRDLFGRRKDGTEFPVEVGLNPIHVRDGLLILSVIVDISERKRVERLKDDFVSTVSHELRTPLTSISGSLGLLTGGAAGKLPDQALRLLTIAQANSQRLVRLINDILDIEKMESGQTVFNFERLDARALVETVMESNRGFADSYGVRLQLDPASVTGIVHADPDRLSQVVTNLFSNAIKFSPKNSEVVVTVEQCSDDIRISVRDHGPGIPVEFKPHVFEKFAQAGTGNASRKGGTGLGLSIVKEIITRLGGKVGFDDAPGGGTIFYADLPVWKQAAGSEVDGALGSRNLRARPTILHVDDDHDALSVVAEALGAMAQVVSVDSVDDARKALATHHFDMAVLDIGVGSNSGLDLLSDLRTCNGSPVQVIILSARSGAMDHNPQVRASLGKSQASLDHLAATVRNCLMIESAPASKEEVA